MRQEAVSPRQAGRVAGVVLAVASLLVACGKTGGDGIEQAKALIAKHDRAGALVQLKSVIQAQPESGEARLLLGSQLYENGEATAAAIELNRALELQYPSQQVVPLLAKVMLATGEARKVVDRFAAITWAEAGPTADLKVVVAQAQATIRDMDGAKASVAEALARVPNHEEALLMQVRLAQAGGDAAGAMKQLDAVLARNAQSADAWVLKGDLLGRGSPDPTAVVPERLKAYQQALSIKPDQVAAHAAIIGLHLAMQDVKQAQAQLEQMQKVLPKNPQTKMFEGQLAVARGDFTQAREIFQILLRSAPNNQLLLRTAGLVELRLNAPVQAEVLLSRAHQIAPDSPSVRRLLAQCYLSMGQAPKALAILEPLVAAGSQDAQAMTLAAQARLLGGDAHGAGALFDRAAKLKPDDVRIRTAVAQAHLSQGQEAQGLSELQGVAAKDAGFTADMALVGAQIRRKNYDAALQAVAAMERKQPDSPQAAQMRGQVLMLKQDRAGARKAFEQALARQATFFPAVAALAALDFQDKQLDAAKGRFEALIKIDPKNSAAHLALAELAARAGGSREAVAALLDDAVKANTTDLVARKALIEHHLATDNTKAALVAAQAALAAMPDNYDVLTELGHAQMAARETQQAVNTYNRMITLQGKAPWGHVGLAQALAANQEAPAAMRSVRKALEVSPGYLPALRTGMALAMQQKLPAQAMEFAREVQKLQPEEAEGFIMEGEIEASQKHWDPAITVLRKAVAKNHPAQSPQQLHQALRAAGKSADADAWSATWTKAHPADALFLLYLGDVALTQKDLAGAEQRYRAVLAIQPEHPLALNNVAWVMVQQKKPGAVALAERAVKAAPDRAPLLDTLATAQAAEGQVGKAIETQKRALVLRPDEPGLRLNLAAHYVQNGDKRQAKEELDRLAAMGDRFPRQAEVEALLKKLTTW